MSVGLLVIVIGADREPTSSLLADLRRLGYQAELVVWPTRVLRLRGIRPVAVWADLRALGVDAGPALQAVREERALRDASVVALVPEQEAARLDPSLGFDDLVLTPYRLSELAARMRLLRWRAEQASSNQAIRVGRLAVNPGTYQVTIDGHLVELTLKEYQLLLFLIRNPGRVFTREELLHYVWGDDYLGGTRTVDVHIRRLRAKTEEAGELIETVRGVGYRLAPQ